MDTKTVIAELRGLGKSQAAIAAECELSQGAISHIETGRRKDVRASTHERLVSALEKAKAEAAAQAQQEAA
ncbi:helix-turn-helix transcriptional regulator [Achromobacter sp. GD03932]|uniref:helix-turn-helix domain-containing protein n=1 Tax=Achromobacter sp. GD03932 TaxID=2975407 RepID=UPI00244858D8|nr:helix-turn-helix transcriptional regulator [Achromobacter sp. GD03932]MDH1299703.1 helix-turn-helix domain-containing protein [Achromobacter sp. GD03932]